MTNTEEKEAMTQAAPVQPVPPQTKEIQPTAYPAGEKKEGFRNMRQGTAINALSETGSRGPGAKIDPVTGATVIAGRGLTVMLEQYENKTIRLQATTQRLLHVLLLKYSESEDAHQKAGIITLSLKEYKILCGLKDHTAAREQVNRELKTLEKMTLEWEETQNYEKGKGSPYFYRMRPISTTAGVEENGNISVRLNPDFLGLLKRYYLLPYPLALLKINQKRHPHSFYLGYKIATNKRINYGKKRADIISVKTLLQASPEMPRYSEIKTIGGISQRIIDPLERDLDALQDILSWEYCKKNGAPLTEKEIAGYKKKPPPYDTFIQWNIKVTWHDYPIQDKLKKSKELGHKKALKVKEKETPQ